MDKQYNHETAELNAQQLWRDQLVYAPENNAGPLYTIDTPPPTVSGSLHIGHIFSYTQTDIIARYARMQGRSVFYPFGFDDNGLPTEKFVEKKLDIKAHDMGRSAFINTCLEATKPVEAQFEQLWTRIGLSVDWRAKYATIDDRSRYISQLSFIELYNKGYVYRKEEPALYCTTCRTTVAQAELDDLEKATQFTDLVFTADNEKLIIATTRPELLAAVNAVLYHPEDSRYTHLAGKKATVPYYEFTVPLIADELVDPEKGTGLVMCSTFGDKTDVHWFKVHNLPYKPIIGLDGKLTSEAGPLEGMRVPTARKTILDLLRTSGAIAQEQPHQHAVNVHERCKKEIEYLVLTQWFLELLPHKETFIALGEQVAWHPSFMKARYVNWVENISWDWCLSRQRFYGIPFPAWHCVDCKAVVLATPDQLPLDPQETPYEGNCSCGSTEFVADTDVMDTWNTSSLTPYICASLRMPVGPDLFDRAGTEFLPMTMRPQAHDIIRTWAFDTIVKAWMHNEKIPWDTIVISGHVLSNQKEKISKSKGNTTTDPEQLLAQYPADAIRYWTASGSLGHDVSFSENQIKIGRKLLVKLWNACRFMQPHMDMRLLGTEAPDELGLVNRWILSQASGCFRTYGKYFADYECSIALTTVEQFFWHDVCDNYLEIVKDQLMNPADYRADEVTATKWTMTHLGMRILQLYAPFVPYVTETIYGELYKEALSVPSLHMTKFANFQQDIAAEHEQTMKQLLTIISTVRKLKSEAQVSLRTELATLTIGKADASLAAHTTLIRGITKAAEVTITIDEVDTKLHVADNTYSASLTV